MKIQFELVEFESNVWELTQNGWLGPGRFF